MNTPAAPLKPHSPTPLPSDKTWTTQAKSLLAARSLDPLVRLLEEVLAKDPAEHEARQLLGVALSMKGDHVQAVSHISQAIALTDFNPDWMFNQGNVYRSAGQLVLAEMSYRKLLSLAPGHAHGWFNLANLLSELKRDSQAIEAYRRALWADPLYTKAQINLAGALSRTGEFEQSLAVYRQLLEREPKHFGARNNMANLLRELGQPPEAERLLRQLAEEDPSSARAQNNLGSALRELGRLEEALACYERALTLKPAYPEGRMNYGMALLSAGRWEEGWKSYESRLDPGLNLLPNPYRALPAWTGQSLAGKSIIVHGEQGLGDMIQFSRFVPSLQAMGAQVYLVTQSVLVRLFKSLPFSGQVVAEGEPLPTNIDYQVSLLSLPFLLRIHSAADFMPKPYLKADPHDVAIWRERLDAWFPRAATRKPRVGLVWAGNPRRDMPMASLVDRRRSLSTEHATRLVSNQAMDWVSLQKGEGESTLSGVRSAAPFLKDFADTAAACAALDAVITVDTSVAHLAGAIGCPTYMLSRFDACWRWGLSGTSTHWYESMQIFRQPSYGHWSAVIDQVDALLKNRFELK